MKVLIFLLLFSSLAFAGAPNLQVHLSSKTFEKGKPIEISYEVKGVASKKTSIGFFLIRLNSSDGKPQNQGPLSTSGQEIALSGKGVFQWDGHSMGCAPPDMNCDRPPNPGQYEIQAIIYDEPKALLVAGEVLHADRANKGPKVLILASSSVFTVTGDFDLSRMKSDFRAAVAQLASQKYKSSNSVMGEFVEMNSEVTGHDQGPYCQKWNYKIPFQGEGNVCGLNPEDPQKIEVSGAVSMAKGKISFDEVIKVAMASAETPYRERLKASQQKKTDADIIKDGPGVMFSGGKRYKTDTSYLRSSFRRGTYRPEENSWIMIIDESKAGGSGKTGDPFADEVLVRVGDDGKACVVETWPLRSRHADLAKVSTQCSH